MFIRLQMRKQFYQGGIWVTRHSVLGAYAVPNFKTCLYIHSFQLEVCTAFRHLFHSELSVVWDKRSLVANKIESKSYYSPLILHHSVRVLQKYPLEHIKNKRFVETVLLSTHETFRERSGSQVECSTRDQGATGSSLIGVTALWSLSKTHLS